MEEEGTSAAKILGWVFASIIVIVIMIVVLLFAIWVIRAMWGLAWS